MSTHALTTIVVAARFLGGITRSIWFSYLDSKSGRVEKGLIVSASPGDISRRVFAFMKFVTKPTDHIKVSAILNQCCDLLKFQLKNKCSFFFVGK